MGRGPQYCKAQLHLDPGRGCSKAVTMIVESRLPGPAMWGHSCHIRYKGDLGNGLFARCHQVDHTVPESDGRLFLTLSALPALDICS